MVKTLLSTLNAYAKEYQETQNKNILPAIGRISNRIEEITGKKLKVEVVNGEIKYSI